MIFTHYPPGSLTHFIEYPIGIAETKVLVVDPDSKRIAVWESGHKYHGNVKVNGYREITEIDRTNLETLPPVWQSYAIRWLQKWKV